MQTTKIQLNTAAVLNIPLKNYNEEFSFIVNGKEYKTSKLVSNLLSPNICKMHSIDQTFDQFVINTKEKGNFSYVLDLINFEKIQVPMKELAFLTEVVEILGNDSIQFLDKMQPTKITKKNVFSLIRKHEKYNKFYSKELLEDIDFISSNFYEIYETQKEELLKLPFDIILDIVNNSSLQLKEEDQLLYFVNELYSTNTEYSILYETIFFSNVSSKAMNEFIKILDFKDLNKMIWIGLSNRLEQKKEDINNSKYRYEKAHNQGIIFEPNSQKQFFGIFNYIRNKTNDNIENEINITSSSILKQYEYSPVNVTIFNNDNTSFLSKNEPNQWICFDFKDHRVSPTHYTIKLRGYYSQNDNPKNWVIEGSFNNSTWEILDERNNCSDTKDRKTIYTFSIEKRISKEFKYIRMRQTGPNWEKSDYLHLLKFEIYGRYI